MLVYLSSVSSSRWFRSQAMYSNAASVTRGHHDKSRDLNFLKFSAMSSIPSSVIFEQPDKDKTVKLGSVCTENTNKRENSFPTETSQIYIDTNILIFVVFHLFCNDFSNLTMFLMNSRFNMLS